MKRAIQRARLPARLKLSSLIQRPYLLFLLIFIFTGLGGLLLSQGRLIWLSVRSSDGPGVTEPPVLLLNDSKQVFLLLWNNPAWSGFGVRNWKPPNYVGYEVVKPVCPVPCFISLDKRLAGQADAILFEPIAWGQKPEWRRNPIWLPEKRAYQRWVQFGYEHADYFPLAKEPAFVNRIDVNMTYDQNSSVPITFACSFGGKGKIQDYLEPPPSFSSRNKFAVFIASNCLHGGAIFRTRYVEELMKYIPVDSYGACLHNKEFPAELQPPVSANSSASTSADDKRYWEDPGTVWKVKNKLLAEYKFVLAFENNNKTDYVTEKVFNAWQAGTVPVYMGAPNIDEWTPGDHSLIKVSDFRSPKDLAYFLMAVSEDKSKYDRYLSWKNSRNVSERFSRKYQRCVFYSSECRLCSKIAELRRSQPKAIADRLEELRARGSNEFALQFDGVDDYIQFPLNTPQFDLDQDMAILAWINPMGFSDFRIVDKNPAGTIRGYNFDLIAGEKNPTIGYLRFCGAAGCYSGYKPLEIGNWVHVGMSLKDGRLQLWVNGFEDGVSVVVSGPLEKNSLALRFGSAASGGSFWAGQLDDISIWNRALSTEEVRRAMMQKLRGDEEGLVGYWPFDEGSGDTIRDISSNGLVGILQGDPTWISMDIRPMYSHQCQ